MKNFKLLLCFIFSLSMVTFAYAKDINLQKKEVKAFVWSALKYIKENGKEQALNEFNKKDGKFIKGELYIFAYDYKGNCLANGENPKLVGQYLYDSKDIKGKFVVRELVKSAKTGGGWVNYYWSHPINKKYQYKISYVEPVDNEYFISSGYYPTQHKKINK